jgi:ligand-binding sensor domain-containing protein/signal transduction histidine kinase
VSSASDASAQRPFRFDSWTTDHGLPQNSINDILQTRDGYLWLATHGGLVRFDGVRFVTFDASAEGLRSQRFRTLHEDRQGTLWAATEDGMLVRYRGGRFMTYSSEDGLPHAGAIRIEESDDGRLWITWLGVVTVFDGHRFQNFQPSDFAHRVAVPPVDRYVEPWWGPTPGGLRALVRGSVQTFAIADALGDSAVSGVRIDRCGQLWITTNDNRIIKAGPDGRARRYPTDDADAAFPSQGVFVGDCADRIWFLDAHGNVSRLRDGRREPIGVSGVRSVFVDSEGSEWFGTIAAGLHRLRDDVIAVHTLGDGPEDNFAYTIAEDRTGTIWIGSGGLKSYRDSRVRSHIRAERASDGRVTALYEDRSGRVWVGMSDGLRYVRDGRLVAYDDDAGLSNVAIRAVLQDRAGRFWFATDTGLVTARNGAFTRYTKADGLSHDRVMALFEDREGSLWIGGFRGVTRFRGGTFKAFSERDGLVGNQIRAFHEDGDGVLWIGTYDGGLYRLAHERLTRYTRKQGLHDNGVFQILEDDRGHLWMGSNRGISRVSRQELNELAEGRRRAVTPLVFGTKDGLVSAEVNGGAQPSGLKASDGRLWFPTMAGVAVIDPASIDRSVGPPRVMIEEVRVDDGEVSTAGEIRIPANGPVVEIRFTAPSFRSPERTRFRYRLVGLDDAWIEAGERRTADLQRVPPGRYRFEVSAWSRGGGWSTQNATLALVVLPPFWRTWWFLTLLGAAAVSIVVAAHETRVRRLRRRHVMQAAFSQELIDSQERERRRIAHEMHDSFGHHAAMIKTRAQAAAGAVRDTQRVGVELSEIAGLAEQLKLEMHDIAYGLHPCQLEIIGLSKTVENLVLRAGTVGGIAFTTAIGNIDHLFPGDSGIHVYRIVQEAVSNILAHSSASRATVAIAAESNGIQIRIEDNGTGFRWERFGDGRWSGGGFGLMGMHERARMLGGTVKINSSPDGTAILVAVTSTRPSHG